MQQQVSSRVSKVNSRLSSELVCVDSRNISRNRPQLSVFLWFQKISLSQYKPLNNCVLIGTLMFLSISHQDYVFVMTIMIDNDNLLLRRFR